MKIQFGLMGGLGNQLFQMCAALVMVEKYQQQVTLNPNFGSVRENARGVPEILSFNLPSVVVVSRRRFHSRWVSRLFGHARKIAISPVGYERYRAYETMIAFFTRAQTIFLIGPKGQVNFIKEVGFHAFEEVAENKIFLGYFQSYKYLKEGTIRNTMMELSTQEYGEVQKIYRELRLISNPLVVHIRRGDYMQEAQFGALSEDYYRLAIDFEFGTGLYDTIWLFSDDFDLAFGIIPFEYHSKVRMVYEAQESSAATLEIMRHGKGFVIANSTFSWWGATLAHNIEARVIAPSPWFQFMDEPKELIPQHWHRISTWGS